MIFIFLIKHQETLSSYKIKHTDQNVNVRLQGCAKCMWEAEMRFTDKNGKVEKNMKNIIGNTSLVRTKNSEGTTVKEISDCE